jgi:hypothetical protein
MIKILYYMFYYFVKKYFHISNRTRGLSPLFCLRNNTSYPDRYFIELAFIMY